MSGALPTGQLSRLGTFTLLLTSSLTIMVGTVVAPALPAIAAQLGFAHGASWLVTLPSLGVVLFAPLMGRLIDRYGPRRVMLWGLLPYGMLGMAALLRLPSYLLIADRLLLGATTAALAASGTGLIAEFFSGAARLRLIAWQGVAIELGGVVFLSLGGLLGEQSWRYPFGIYLVAWVCFGLLLVSIPRPAQREAALAMPEVLAEANGLAGVYVGSALAMVLFFVAFVGLPMYLPQAFGFSESETGYLMAGISMVAVVAASQLPRVTGWLTAPYTLALGFLLFAGAHGLFAGAASLPALLGAVGCLGLGFGFTVPLLNHLTVERSSPHQRGRNLSYYSMCIFLGQFLSSFLDLVSTDARRVFELAAGLALLVAVGQVVVARRANAKG